MDEYVRGNIIFGWDRYVIDTLNPKTKTARVIAGSLDSYGYQEGVGSNARFSKIYGMYQWNRTFLLVSDSGNSCVRYIDRVTRRSGLFAGQCSSPGFSDGIGSNARLNNPHDITLDKTNPSSVLIADHDNNAIRSADVNSRSMVTVLSNLASAPRRMAWSEENSTLYLGMDSGTVSVNWTTKAVVQLKPSNANLNYPGNSLFYSALTTQPFGFRHVHGNIFAYALHNGSVYVMNMEHRTAFTLCAGSTTNCTFPSIHSLSATTDGPIYLGLHRKIQNLSGTVHIFICKL